MTKKEMKAIVESNREHTWTKVVTDERLSGSWIFNSKPEYFRAWCWMLSNANWGEDAYFRNGLKSVFVKHGEIAGSINYLSQKVGMKQAAARNMIKNFKLNRLVSTRIEEGITVFKIRRLF